MAHWVRTPKEIYSEIVPSLIHIADKQNKKILKVIIVLLSF
jgi:hypothetical protein